MMQAVVAQITILLLLAHAALGCCWHHAHEHLFRICGHEHETMAAVLAADVDASPPHLAARAVAAHACNRSAPAGEHRHHDPTCPGTRCVFLMADRGALSSGARVPVARPICSAESSLEHGEGCRPDGSLSGTPRFCANGSLRSHLALCVLLI